jgi:predicted CXXCH cytochrome family protein
MTTLPRLALSFSLAVLLGAAEDAGKIMRPADHSSFPGGAVDIVAGAQGGRLELDGKPVAAEQPFPAVLHAKVEVPPGPHTLVLSWEGGRKEVRFFTGGNAPPEFHPFRSHPPQGAATCTQCHELSARGRFRFKNGACFDCHKTEGFAKVHTHDANVLAECGLCHNAHGSAAKAHLLYAKETACKQCHN